MGQIFTAPNLPWQISKGHILIEELIFKIQLSAGKHILYILKAFWDTKHLWEQNFHTPETMIST